MRHIPAVRSGSSSCRSADTKFDNADTDADDKRHAEMAQPLFDRVNALPGVQSAALSCFGPMSNGNWTGRLSSPQAEEKNSQPVRVVGVSPRYFETMGIRILAGRAVHNMRFADPREPFGALAFIPIAQQEDVPVTSIILRTQGDPTKYAGDLREIIRQLDPSRSLGAITRLSDQIDEKLASDDAVAALTSAFGILALILTCMGIYAVVGYAAARRTQEIGIRLALGASRSGISGMIFRDLGKLLAVSAVLGFAGALEASRLLRNTLFGIDPVDLAVPLGAALLLSAVAVLAAYLPARRAARLDPMQALRQD